MVKTLILTQIDAAKLLPMRECIAVMEKALTTLANGDALQPLRSVMWSPDKKGLLGMMPSYLGAVSGNMPAIGLKALTVFPGNHNTEFDSHQGVILLFETNNGLLQAVVDATSVTAIRTAAVSAVATKLLAREDAGDLAILGSSTQAIMHLEAMMLARKLRRVRIWSRNPENAAGFAKRESKRHAIKIEPVLSVQSTVAGADLICVATSAREPVLMGEWITAGAHINAVGACVAAARELDTAAVVKSSLFVDRRESAMNEAGDFLIPRQEGAIKDDHIRGEIGEVLAGKVQGRRSLDEITLFKSLGLGVEDLAAADYIYRKALEKGIGVSIALGGEKQ